MNATQVFDLINKEVKRRQVAITILGLLIDRQASSVTPCPVSEIIEHLEKQGVAAPNARAAMIQMEGANLINKTVYVNGMYAPASDYQRGPRYYLEGEHLPLYVSLDDAVSTAFNISHPKI